MWADNSSFASQKNQTKENHLRGKVELRTQCGEPVKLFSRSVCLCEKKGHIQPYNVIRRLDGGTGGCAATGFW